jgi:hypothetical protein
VRDLKDAQFSDSIDRCYDPFFSYEGATTWVPKMHHAL